VASVELKGLSKRYGDAVAVDGVSLDVEHGRLVFLELSSTLPALKNTFILAPAAATLGALLSLLIA